MDFHQVEAVEAATLHISRLIFVIITHTFIDNAGKEQSCWCSGLDEQLLASTLAKIACV